MRLAGRHVIDWRQRAERLRADLHACGALQINGRSVLRCSSLERALPITPRRSKLYWRVRRNKKLAAALQQIQQDSFAK